MIENLVIVESPAKAQTIEKFLGKDFTVKSSYGHIRDLEKNTLSIDLENNFKPLYIVPEDKKKLVSELKKLVKESKIVWLASDEDREGEAISWHLYEELGLKKEQTRRIVFNEITKDAILKAIKNPRFIDENLVNAQQARRLLDRMVGYEISPILWRKVRPSLSAGRVQSVAVRLIVEREREITAFKSSSSYRVAANFHLDDLKKNNLIAELPNKIENSELTLKFLEKCKNATFKVADVFTKPSKKSPAAPFTTSTLQQEASRKLGYSVAQTMTIAQKLYESGKITYMRTDSVNLSETAVGMAKDIIVKEFGAKYSNPRQFKTKSKGAQEAHEAIRPTYMANMETEGSSQEKRLYELIWKRTVASQMSDAALEKTTAIIDISTTKEKLEANGEVIKFDGFLKVYLESTDDENEEENTKLLPPLSVGQVLKLRNINATERFTYHPPRYTEASLVKKLEELGIGRPSTYAPTISTIQQRGYIIKEDKLGNERKFNVFILQDNKIEETVKTEITGAEKSKLFPNDIGLVVNDFLVSYFQNILDYNFTASVEKQFDEIAEGTLKWTDMIGKFYHPFHTKVTETIANSERNVGERNLGIDTQSGKTVLVKIGRFGPMAQIGEASDEDKPRFASLLKGQRIDTISLEEALELFKLPRIIGQFEGKDVTAGIGRFGPYIVHNSKFVSLKAGVDDPFTISIDRAVELINIKRIDDQNKTILTFSQDADLTVLNGRWGAYISYKKENYKIPKTQDATKLSYEACMEIIKTTGSKSSGRKTISKSKVKTISKTKAKKK